MAMKYKCIQLVELCCWIALFLAFALSFFGNITFGESAKVSSTTIAIAAGVGILISTSFMLLILYLHRRAHPFAKGLMEGFLSASISFVGGMVFHRAADALGFVGVWRIGISAIAVCALGFAIFFIRRKQLLHVAVRSSNFLFAIWFGLAAALFGLLFSPVAAVILLAVAAVYDAWAVWKSGHMQSMARGLMNLGIIPGFGVYGAVKEGDAIGMLGGGDLLFLAIVPLAFLSSGSVLYATTTLLGGLAGLVYLMVWGDPKKSYPALPYQLAGVAAAISLTFISTLTVLA
jgi:presenilin-like A22 family membrane protease